MERSTDSNSRWIAACCGVIIAALYVVAFVSKTELRHLVQTVPLWLGVVLALLGVRVAKWVVLPILLFWLAAMTFIWLFLLGWSRVISGHFSPVEIAMTVVIGTSALIGLLFSMKGKRQVTPLGASCVFLLSDAFQFAAFRISMLPGIARR